MRSIFGPWMTWIESLSGFEQPIQEGRCNRRRIRGTGSRRTTRHLGIQVALIERNEQVLKPVDLEFARIITATHEGKGVELLLATDIQSIEFDDSAADSKIARALISVTDADWNWIF